ncbi:MAG: zinc ribbon domain-containing protein [Ruminococcus sp.]|nr:zinc ribbon domain-containing protein [Ruminococcus sp.]
MFCGKCGNELPDGAKFCGKCGTSQNVTETAPEVNVSSVQNGKPIYCQRSEYQGEVATPKKKLPLIIGIVAAVIVIIIVIAVIVNSLTKFSIESVKGGSLTYLDEDITIGEAFDNTFHNGKWKYDEDKDKNEYYVFFDGYFYAEDGDEIEAKIGFVYDSDVNKKGEFEVFAVELEDDYGNEADLYNDEDFVGFFNYVFKDEEFEWYWDNYDDYDYYYD